MLLASDQPLFEAPPADLHPTSSLDRKWWSLGLPRHLKRIGAHLFHGTDFAVPWAPSWIAPCPSVMTIHDLSPWHESSPQRLRIRRRTNWQIRLRLAQRYLTPSDTIRHELIQRFHLPQHRVLATPLAASRIFQPASHPTPRHVLFVGTRESRKNLELFDSIAQHFPDIPFLAIGRDPHDTPTYRIHNTHILRDVSDPQLAALYQNAWALLFPSRYEGFGLPILEAMQSGCPVLAADTALNRELFHPAATLLPPDHPQPWIATLQSWLDSQSLWTQQRLHSIHFAARFSWTQTALATIDAYHQALA